MSAARRSKVVSSAESRLIRFIAQESLKPGDALPGEIELAQRMGLSRASLREALGILRQTRCITTARRQGMRLARPLPFLPLERLAAGGVDPDTVAELCELRLIVEVGAAPRLCAKVDERDLADLRDLCGQEQAAIGDFDGLRAIDRSFHARLLAIVANPQVEHLHQILLTFFDTARYQASFDVWKARRQPMRLDHSPLVEALADHDATRLAGLMERHLAVHLGTRHGGKGPQGGMNADRTSGAQS